MTTTITVLSPVNDNAYCERCSNIDIALFLRVLVLQLRHDLTISVFPSTQQESTISSSVLFLKHYLIDQHHGENLYREQRVHTLVRERMC